MGWIRDSIRDYVELYRPLRRSFIGWRSPLVLWPGIFVFALAITSAILQQQVDPNQLSWNQGFLQFLIIELTPPLIMLCMITAWFNIALANSHNAQTLLEPALMGGNRVSGWFRFLLGLHSGLVPLLVAVCGLAIVHLSEKPPYWGFRIVDVVDNFGYLLCCVAWTAICLAVYCVTASRRFTFFLFALFAIELVFRVFLASSNFPRYWDSFGLSGQRLDGYYYVLLILALLLPLSVMLGHLFKRDTMLMLSTAFLSLVRLVHIALLSIGFADPAVYGGGIYTALYEFANDDTTGDLIEGVWILNGSISDSLFSLEFTDNYMMRSLIGDPYLVFMHQLRLFSGSPLAMAALALLGNLAWLFLVCVVCLYCVRRHEREMVS